MHTIFLLRNTYTVISVYMGLDKMIKIKREKERGGKVYD